MFYNFLILVTSFLLQYFFQLNAGVTARLESELLFILATVIFFKHPKNKSPN